MTMTRLTAFILSLLLHIIVDFHLQGILSSMKQKDWWKRELEKPENAKFNEHASKYKYDYIAALAIHSIEWAIAVSIPYLIASGHPLSISWKQLSFITAHAVLHGVVDDMKCNEGKLNLIKDQMFHLSQLMSLLAIIGM